MHGTNFFSAMSWSIFAEERNVMKKHIKKFFASLHSLLPEKKKNVISNAIFGEKSFSSGREEKFFFSRLKQENVFRFYDRVCWMLHEHTAVVIQMRVIWYKFKYF